MKKIIFICLFIFICFNLSFALSWYDVLQDENFSSLNNKIDSSFNYLLFLFNNLFLSDTVFLQITNPNFLYADSSISGETQFHIINDTSCFIIDGNYYGIDLKKFDFSYKVNFNNNYWVESSLLIYFDESNNRIIIKADYFNFPPNSIKVNLFKVKFN